MKKVLLMLFVLATFVAGTAVISAASDEYIYTPVASDEYIYHFAASDEPIASQLS